MYRDWDYKAGGLGCERHWKWWGRSWPTSTGKLASAAMFTLERMVSAMGGPGGAWAARREAIAGGLYDRHAIGGGDSAMLCTWEGREKLPQSLKHGTACEAYYRKWANRSYELVCGSLACVAGDVGHLYHGTRQNRQYVERYKIFHDHAYDPVRDVEVDPETGLLQWSAAAREQKPALVRRVAEYFERRREDE